MGLSRLVVVLLPSPYYQRIPVRTAVAQAFDSAHEAKYHPEIMRSIRGDDIQNHNLQSRL